MVENNGGKLDVEREVGKGSIFKVFLKVKGTYKPF
jgi:signal transduction histidine kinase